MRTIEEIIQEEKAIIIEAEKCLETDTYYQDQEYDMAKLSYKYGRITMSLAFQITDLKKQLKK